MSYTPPAEDVVVYLDASYSPPSAGTLIYVGDNIAVGLFSALTGSAEGGVTLSGEASGAFPSLTGYSEGLTFSSAIASGSFQSLTGSASGAITAVFGYGAGGLPVFTGSAYGTVTVVGSVTATFPAITGASVGITGETQPDVFAPVLVFPSYQRTHGSIQIDITDLDGLSIADADAANGDWTKITEAFFRTIRRYQYSLEAIDQPTTMRLWSSTSESLTYNGADDTSAHKTSREDWRISFTVRYDSIAEE